MTSAGAMRNGRPQGRRPRSFLTLPAALIAGTILLAAGYVAYVLWPRWPGQSADLDAPAVPIIVANTRFNVPPAAIRVKMQRRAGAQERLDLAFLWPSLNPPDPATQPAAGAVFDRLFVTIVGPDGTLPPSERTKTIYPRYLDSIISAGPDGLAVRPFRTGTPYAGEDLIYDPSAPELFTIRCNRGGGGATPGMCLYDRRVGQADLTIRFPRDWLNEWRSLQRGMEKLIGKLAGPAAG